MYEELFPSPPGLVAKIVPDLKDLKGKLILDPSAGTGALLDECARRLKSIWRTEWGTDRVIPEELPLYAVEIDPDLQAILREHGHRVVWADFLTYVPSLRFDWILANPPFQRGLEHFEHMWEILPEGGTVQCVQNAVHFYADGAFGMLDTSQVVGQSSKAEWIVRLVQQCHGRLVYLGQPYLRRAANTADRDTKAEMVLIRLTKPRNAKFSFEFEFEVRNERDDKRLDEDDGPELSVALHGLVDQISAEINVVLQHAENYLRERRRMEKALSRFDVGSVLQEAGEGATLTDQYNRLSRAVQRKAWDLVFDDPRWTRLMTVGAVKLFNDFKAQRRLVEFNQYNVLQMFELFAQHEDELLEQCVQDAFEIMTANHLYNRVNFRGWKSNSAYYAAKRLVLPRFIETTGFYKDRVKWEKQRALDDIDRAICHVMHLDFTTIRTCCQALNDYPAGWLTPDNEYFDGKGFSRPTGSQLNTVYSTFFKCRFYPVRAGTLHLYWRDPLVWKSFNEAASRHRNWLPPGAGDAWADVKPPTWEMGDAPKPPKKQHSWEHVPGRWD